MLDCALRAACKLRAMRAKIQTGIVTLYGATEQYSVLVDHLSSTAG